MKILLVGGSKSGKSHLAQSLIKKLSNGRSMVYLATMEPVDSEDDERILRHIEDRDGWGFSTVEKGRDIDRAVIPPEASVLLDSVTALLANEMFTGSINRSAAQKTLDELKKLSDSCENIVCVADEVFRDGSVYEELTEEYRRSLAVVLRGLSVDFDVVSEVVSGMPKLFKGELPL